MIYKKMLYAVLWLADMIGVLSLLWTKLPIPEIEYLAKSIEFYS